MGILVYGYISDTYGRRVIFSNGLIVILISNIVFFSIKNVYVYILFAFLGNLSLNLLQLITITSVESMSKKYYSTLNGVFNSLFGICGLISILIMYLTENWNNILIMHIIIDVIVVILYFKFVVETPLYNLSTKSYGKYLNDIVYISKMNGVYETIVKEKIEYFLNLCKLYGTHAKSHKVATSKDNRPHHQFSFININKLDGSPAAPEKARKNMRLNNNNNNYLASEPADEYINLSANTNIIKYGNENPTNLKEKFLEKDLNNANYQAKRSSLKCYNKTNHNYTKTKATTIDIANNNVNSNNTNNEIIKNKKETHLETSRDKVLGDKVLQVKTPRVTWEEKDKENLPTEAIASENNIAVESSVITFFIKKYLLKILEDIKTYFTSIYKRYSLIFGHKTQRNTFLFFLLPYLSVMIGYYGQLMFVEKLPGNILLNSFLIYSSDIMAPNVAGYILRFFGRKKILTIFHACSIFICLNLPHIPVGMLYTIILFLNCFIINFINVATDIFAAESFDSSVKSSAMGLLILSGFLSNVFVDSLMDLFGTPFYLFALLSLFSIASIYNLKEPDSYLEE